jgi:hypothetical protein
MENLSIIQYIWIGVKMFIVSLISGVIMLIPMSLLGAGVTTASVIGANNALLAMGVVGVLLLVVGFALNGVIANKIWEWK